MFGIAATLEHFNNSFIFRIMDLPVGGVHFIGWMVWNGDTVYLVLMQEIPKLLCMRCFGISDRVDLILIHRWERSRFYARRHV